MGVVSEHNGMGGKVILFGATGYTGQLTAEAMARRGMTDVVIAGRDANRLSVLAATLAEAHGWNPTVAVADTANPQSVRALVTSPEDVLVTTVGPYTKFGEPAIEAATSSGAMYVDASGEASFLRRVFEYYGPRARRTGAALIPAFGYDYVPGNLAGLLALEQARDAGFAPTRLEIGYFVARTGPVQRSISGGTAISSLATLTENSFTFMDGVVQTERPAARVRSFDFNHRQRDAISVGGTEHFTLPAMAPELKDVHVYIGWANSRSTQVSIAGRLFDPIRRLPLVSRAVSGVGGLVVRGSSGGPSASDRAGADTLVVAEAYALDRQVARTVVQGPSPYDLTADLLALAADTCVQGGLGVGSQRRSGALGPIEAFGREAFIDGCGHLGLAALD